MAEKSKKATCKTCQFMDPEFARNGRNIFYCTHPEARTECSPHRIITRSKDKEIPTKSAPKWCPLSQEDHPSKNHCKNCRYAEGYGEPDRFYCSVLYDRIRDEQRGCQFFSQRKGANDHEIFINPGRHPGGAGEKAI